MGPSAEILPAGRWHQRSQREQQWGNQLVVEPLRRLHQWHRHKPPTCPQWQPDYGHDMVAGILACTPGSTCSTKLFSRPTVYAAQFARPQDAAGAVPAGNSKGSHAGRLLNGAKTMQIACEADRTPGASLTRVTTFDWQPVATKTAHQHPNIIDAGLATKPNSTADDNTAKAQAAGAATGTTPVSPGPVDGFPAKHRLP